MAKDKNIVDEIINTVKEATTGSSEVNGFSINTENPCSKCGKGGAIVENPDGLCLSCATENLESQIKKNKAKKPEFVMENCKVRLTQAEIMARTGQLMQTLNSVDKKQADLDELKKSYQAEIKGLETEARSLRNVIDSGHEWRDVECIEEFNYAKGQVTIRRTDTDEVVRVRPMKDNERQSQLFANA